MATIQEHLGPTVEELSVTFLPSIDGKGTTLTDMKGFQRLRTLELVVDALIGPAYDKGSTNPEWQDDEGRTGEPALPRLVDLLPPSIERLGLFVQYEDRFFMRALQARCLERLFAGFREEREAELPKLREVAIYCSEKVKAEVQVLASALQQAEDAGATMVWDNLAQPSFVTTFRERCGVDRE